MNKLTLLLVSVIIVNYVCSYNILVVFPHPGKSHAILGAGYVHHLLNAGHEVTHITAFPVKPHPRLKQIDVSSTIAPYHKDLEVLALEALLAGNQIIDDFTFLYELCFAANNRSIQHPNIQKFLKETNEKYDLAIIQWINSELNTGYAAVFNIPYIWASSYEHHPVILSLIDEHQNPVSFRHYRSAVSSPLTFQERISELWSFAYLVLTIWLTKDKSEIAFKKAFGPAAAQRNITLPTLEELKYKGSLAFGNAHVAMGEANKLPQSYIPIGGYHIEDAEPLPENFQKAMDEAQDGVIYFSMGSNTKSSSMPQELKRGLLKVFGELKQTVIWKYEEQLEDKPKNVLIVQWAPQPSILAHPNCILFITHGGLLSVTEALHFNVPIIGIPLYMDHFANMMRAVKKGYALQVDLNYDMPANLKVAIQEVLSNPKYREKMEEFSFIYHHRPIQPGAALVHWVEHVIKTNGAHHLRSPALHIAVYQKMYLDLLGVIIIGFLIFIWILKKLFSYLQNQALKTKIE